MFNELNWIIIPGGPGLSADYLRIGFNNTFIGYNLHYYEPLASPANKTDHIPKIDELVAQIFTVADSYNLPQFGLITHSFGSYLALQALEKNKSRITSLIMVSPMPMLYKNWRQTMDAIIKKIPPAILMKILMLSKIGGNGSKIFELLFPYYVTKSVPNLPNIPFDMKACEKIASQVTEYDYREFLKNLDLPWYCIIGENDPFYLEKELLTPNSIILKNVGHYPFFEDQAAFASAIKQISN
jgi:pimeloyl-ACP methyl ester carboxylesterase